MQGAVYENGSKLVDEQAQAKSEANYSMDAWQTLRTSWLTMRTSGAVPCQACCPAVHLITGLPYAS